MRRSIKYNDIISGLDVDAKSKVIPHNVHICKRRHFNNGIRPSKWKEFKTIARGVLEYEWNQMTNEILYWTDN
ncbi:MAG: hypothetical protein IKP68_00040 [Clostridia bacterium]|nr:hypothetical protein [Clostridia bacterium]